MEIPLPDNQGFMMDKTYEIGVRCANCGSSYDQSIAHGIKRPSHIVCDVCGMLAQTVTVKQKPKSTGEIIYKAPSLKMGNVEHVTEEDFFDFMKGLIQQ